MPKINTINDFTTAVHTALAAAFPECCVEITSVTKTMECARTVLLSRQKIKQSFLHSIWSRILKKFSPEKRWKKSSDRSSAAAWLHYPIRKPVLMQMTLQILNLSRTISVISWLISSLTANFWQKCRIGITTDLPLSTISGMPLRKEF